MQLTPIGYSCAHTNEAGQELSQTGLSAHMIQAKDKRETILCIIVGVKTYFQLT